MIYGNYDMNEYNFSERDREKLELLDIQLGVQITYIVSNLLIYLATIESINLIYGKYTDSTDGMPNPDIPILQGILLSLAGQLVATQIAITRYNNLSELQKKGEFDYSLQPNMNIIIANLVGIVQSYIFAVAIYEIYERDLEQPIFGV